MKSPSAPSLRTVQLALHVVLCGMFCTAHVRFLEAKTTIVAFGDSTTAPRGDLDVYARLLASGLTGKGLPSKVVNAGVGGNDTVLARRRFQKDVLAHHPDVVIIQFGINDAAVDVWKQPPATTPRVSIVQFEANLRFFVATLKSKGSQVILMTPNPLRWTPKLKQLYGKAPYKPDQKEGFNVLLTDYADAVRGIARSTDTPVIDVYSAFFEHAKQSRKPLNDLLLDGMHPNKHGQRIVAELLFTQLLKDSADKIRFDPRCQPLPSDLLGPFVRLDDGAVLAIDSEATFVSRDDGKTWSAPRPLFEKPRDIKVSNERALLRTKNGVVIAAFMNLKERKWTWKNELHDAPGAKLPTYVMRSLDNGRTWRDVQKLHDDWSGAVRDMIQTEDGRVIFTAMKFRHDPGRHAVLTYSSTDDGATWKASNLIDLGGRGHHGGVVEPTLTELKDGRLWMLIRTNWGEFWSGYSHDGGRFWRVIQPSGIAAGSAPAMLKRMASGRLLLAWNRPYPEGKDTWPNSGGDGLWSDTPVSNHREELSLAFSSDEGKSWTQPVVIARQKNTWLSYPYVYEHQPGEIWLTTMQGGVRMKFREQDFRADR